MTDTDKRPSFSANDMSPPPVRFLPMGDTSLTVEFGQEIDPEINAHVLALKARLAADDLAGIVETLPTFRSLTVYYDPLVWTPGRLEAALRARIGTARAGDAKTATWTVPVCYGGAFGPDLASVAEAAGLAPDDVIARHTARTYTVYVIGFLPGLPYIGPLDPAIDLPRRRDPRVRVAKGSVAIAVGLTVIYPLESPGGWHILGRTPVPLFDLAQSPPAMFAPGDRLRFQAIDRAAYDALLASPQACDWDNYKNHGHGEPAA